MKRLPFEILPTATLVLAPYPECDQQQPAAVHSISSGSSKPLQVSSQPNKTVKYLDEEQGKKILALIYERNGSLDNTSNHEEEEDEAPQKKPHQQQHKSSFYVPEKENKKNKEERVREGGLDMIDKVNDYFRIESKGLVKHIDLPLLLKYDITLDDLIRRCGIAITDLMDTRIIQCVEDLCALKFKMTDLVIDPRLFRVQHLPDLFQLTYVKLRKMKSIRFGALDMIECGFFPNELAQLGFSFDHLINDRGINAKQLKCLNFSLADLISLNLTVENLEKLGITPRIAIEIFGWDRQEYAEFTGQAVQQQQQQQQHSNTRKMNK